MATILLWTLAAAGVATLVLAASILVRAYWAGASPREILFKPRPVPRIGIVEQANVDGRRKLLLVRRDDVEHLILTGGPVDLVIETGIGDQQAAVVIAPRKQPQVA